MSNYLHMTDAQIISEATAIPYASIQSVLGKIAVDHSLLQRLSPRLLKGHGMTEKMSNRFIALIHSSDRVKMIQENRKITKISSPKDIASLFTDLKYLDHERFYILMLNRANYVIAEPIIISMGGISGTVVDTTIVCRHLIDVNASGFVCVHNHPSGYTKPSEADKAITDKISNAAKIIGFTLLDHIIIGDDNYFSFADEGLI